MSQFLETIRIDNGNIPLLQYHSQRLKNTQERFYPDATPIDLSKVIQLPKDLASSYVKCRIVYSDEVHKVEYLEYKRKDIHQIQLVESDISYEYKYEEREKLEQLYSQRGESDDVIIVRDGWLTDSYYGNIALLKYGLWFTPKYPLLKGVMREKLLSEGLITEADLPANSIAYYEKVCLFNSMIDFEEIVLPIEKVMQVGGGSCKIG